MHVPGFISQHHPSQAQYQYASFSGYTSQGCQRSFQLGFSSYIPQYSSQVSSTSNIFYGPSQMFGTTFNTPSSAYNLSPSTSCYCPSLPTQMCDMGHDDDNNNKDDDDADDENGGDHVTQQQHTITREHSRIRGDRGRKPREQQTQVNSAQ